MLREGIEAGFGVEIDHENLVSALSKRIARKDRFERTPGSFGVSGRDDFHLPHFATHRWFSVELKVALDGVSDVVHRLVHRSALGVTARALRAAHRHTIIVVDQSHMASLFHHEFEHRPSGLRMSTSGVVPPRGRGPVLTVGSPLAPSAALRFPRHITREVAPGYSTGSVRARLVPYGGDAPEASLHSGNIRLTSDLVHSANRHSGRGPSS